MAYRRTPRIQARLDAQRADVLVAASAILARSGYAGCTVAAVAAEAGIASGTVYQHFTNKSELLADLFRRVVTREVEAVREAGRTGTAAERTAAVIETFAARALKQPRRAFALLAETVDPAVDALRLEFREAFRDVFAEAVIHGIATGELPPQRARIVAAALVGAVGEALVGPLASTADDPGSLDPDTVPSLVRFAERALGGRQHAHT